MKKDTVSVYNPFNPTQLTAIGEFLSEKESEGLMLDTYTRGKFTFKKSTQKKARYCAVVFRSVAKEEFLASAKEDGWDFISSDRDIYIFRTENTDAKKIDTDKRSAVKSSISAITGTLAFLALIAFHLLRILIFKTGFEVPLEARYSQLTGLALVSGFLIQTVVKITHYIVWRLRALKAIKKNREIPFYNLKQTKRINLFDDLSGIIIMVLWFASLCVFAFGNSSEASFFYFVGGLAVLFIVVILCGRIFFTRKHTAFKVVTLCVLTVFLTVGIYTTAQLSLKAYENNSKSFISHGGNPVSVTEFGITKENANEEEPIENITPFAEYYIFRSRTHKETDNGRKPYIYYYAFRSENKSILDKYENRQRDTMEKYGSTIKELQSDKWDYLCREVHEGEELDCGYAIKGNTIIYLDVIGDITFEEFFESAYKNIF